MKRYPALDVAGAPSDLILARVLEFGPTAAEERGPLLRVFFASASARDAARSALVPTCDVTAVDVPDEDWARRSQDNLTPVTVGGITIVPRAFQSPGADSRSAADASAPVTIVIQPSMGFGTGHHASTRLCLRALQAVDLNGKSVLDVGTGSGVLAIAAVRLGAAPVLGIDFDPDAIESARENLSLNPEASDVSFELADLTARALPRADVIIANLTGPLLVRAAPALGSAVGSAGRVIVGGLLVHEREAVCRAFEPAAVSWEQEEEGWLGMLFTVKKR